MVDRVRVGRLLRGACGDTNGEECWDVESEAAWRMSKCSRKGRHGLYHGRDLAFETKGMQCLADVGRFVKAWVILTNKNGSEKKLPGS
jgi:hypothetical protein